MPTPEAMKAAEACASRMLNDDVDWRGGSLEVIAEALDTFAESVAARREGEMRERAAVVADQLAFTEECQDTVHDLARAAPYRKVAAAIRAIPSGGAQ